MKDTHRRARGVTVIVSTNRPHYFNRCVANFMRQTYKPKELVIILNKDTMSLLKHQRQIHKYSCIHVHKLPEKTSLGRCLNYAISKARYPYIARFDDDDYYGPKYLETQIEGLKQSGADIVGKRACFVYLEASKKLILRYPKEQNRFVKQVAGATLVCRKKLFSKVRFNDRTVGETVGLLRRSLARGYKVYATSCAHFFVRRRKNKRSHTWMISDKKLISQSRRVNNKGYSFHEFVCL
ncbi:glycosyltransferase family 2 protein [Paenibacillus eucommiae]|uniref:Glycosyltransferase involved in cell wall biosynthesis n=1 Tax=Paenibacillus eucommiae TaxID=1355755 RepID=A0ABS4INQ1_9BACL|nr:glycosyltransferase family A protein [Paenibacillus eucommiae]MBP1989179.1 glycosyltransferase involved in cell wall biosynthesis [Paenibacillus eucommiae]